VGPCGRLRAARRALPPSALRADAQELGRAAPGGCGRSATRGRRRGLPNVAGLHGGRATRVRRRVARRRPGAVRQAGPRRTAGATAASAVVVDDAHREGRAMTALMDRVENEGPARRREFLVETIRTAYP